MSYPHHTRQKGVPRLLVHGAFTYCGRHRRSLFDMGHTHRWSRPTDKNAETICINYHRKDQYFKYRNYHFYRVKVKGFMTSKNIKSACRKHKLRPVCDNSHYADGKCRMVGGAWHFSHPHHDRRYGVPWRKVMGAYFYTGRANGGLSLMNTGRTHKWARRNGDRDGDTFCVKRTVLFKGGHKWRSFMLARVPVKGKMQSANIYKACHAKGLRPVCNHPSYADGRCEIVGGNWHMSYPPSTKRARLPRSFMRGTFTYCGYSNHQRSLLDTGNTHRWSRPSDSNGDTLCVKPDRSRKLIIKGEYQLVRIKVNGLMTSPNILQACKAKHMTPVCDHKAYHDGKCLSFGHWHMSHPSHDRQHRISVRKVMGAYFYCGQRNGGRTLFNTGFTHKWSRSGRDRDGDTYCARHASEQGFGECKCKSVNSLMRRLSKVKRKCKLVKLLKAKALKMLSSATELGESHMTAASKKALTQTVDSMVKNSVDALKKTKVKAADRKKFLMHIKEEVIEVTKASTQLGEDQKSKTHNSKQAKNKLSNLHIFESIISKLPAAKTSVKISAKEQPLVQPLASKSPAQIKHQQDLGESGNIVTHAASESASVAEKQVELGSSKKKKKNKVAPKGSKTLLTKAQARAKALKVRCKGVCPDVRGIIGEIRSAERCRRL